MAYDPSNVFARILRGELPCERVFEDEHTLAFRDINPLAPVHVLVIPKGEYASMDDFSAKASPEAFAGIPGIYFSFPH
jgi:diadenosine tetraphosphate (Ap4A) HIT family hydrolase